MGNSLQRHSDGQGNEVVGLIEEQATCELCIQPLSPDTLFKNNERCVHPFCMDCISKYIEVKVGENVGNIPCPALNCKRLLDPVFCRSIISKQVFDKWCDALCTSTVLEFQHRSCCPYQDCFALVTSECEARKVLCPNCKRYFCFKCQTPWHAGNRCQESGQVRDRNDVLFRKLMKRKGWRRCYRCGQCVERVGGCEAIRCRCGADFCIGCGGRAHFGHIHCYKKNPRLFILDLVALLYTVMLSLATIGLILFIFYVYTNK